MSPCDAVAWRTWSVHNRGGLKDDGPAVQAGAGRLALQSTRLSGEGMALFSRADPRSIWCCVHELLQNSHNDILDHSGTLHRNHLCHDAVGTCQKPRAAI